MKNAAALMLFVVFVSVTLFGVGAMAAMGHEHCMTSLIDFVACPQSIAGSIAHHTAAFEILTRAFIAAGAALLLLLAALTFALRDGASLPRDALGTPQRRILWRIPRSRSSEFRALRAWLSRLENSPSFFPRGA